MKTASKLKFILLLSLTFFISQVNVFSDESKNLDNEFETLEQLKKDANELHINNNYQKAVDMYETVMIRILDMESRYKKEIYKKNKNRIDKLKNEITNLIKKEGFYDSKEEFSDRNIVFPNKLKDVIAVAWLDSDTVKVALTTINKQSITIAVNLAYGYRPKYGDLSIDAISTKSVDLKPSILTEITFIGIPKPPPESDYPSTPPGIFLVSAESGNKEIYHIKIQGVKNNSVFSYYNSQYYIKMFGDLNFSFNSGLKSAKDEKQLLYINKNVLLKNLKRKLPITFNEEDINNYNELKNGYVINKFPTKISMEIPHIANDDLLYFDTMQYEAINKKLNENNIYYVQGPEFIILSTNTQINQIEMKIDDDKLMELTPEISADDKIENLIKKLYIDFWNVAENAKIELIKTGTQPVPRLLTELTKNSKIVNLCVEAIGGIGKPALPFLIEYVNKCSKEVDMLLFEDLSRCFSLIGPASIGPLIELEKENNLCKTILICMSLDKIKDKSTGDYLIKILKKLQDGAYALDIDDKNYNIAIGREVFLKALIIHTLGDIKEKKAIPVIIELIEKDPKPKILSEIAIALTKMEDTSTFDPLISLSIQGHLEAIDGLRQMKISEPIPKLLKRFHEYSIKSQSSIAKLCGELGDITLLEDLLKLAENRDTKSFVKKEIDLAILNILNRSDNAK